MEKTGHLEGKKVLLIDPDEKKENDKTFCFWANQEDEIYKDYAPIVTNQWRKIQINDNPAEEIAPFNYFHLNSIDLYEWSRKIIEKFNVTHIKEKVVGIYKAEKLFVESSNTIYNTSWVFDGRPPNFTQIIKKDYYISQSFFGYKVQLDNDKFSEDVYHMMDFRLPQDVATQFIYILPYSKNTALIEITRFGEEILNETTAKKELDEFIINNFGQFKILENEKGVIPMSSILPQNENGSKWLNIGTRAGNVKPSTGYAFKNMYKQAKSICSKKALQANKVSPNQRFLFYDQLLLIILTLWPTKGKPIFEKLFKVKSSYFVLKFLDEKTSFAEDLTMFGKLQIGVFLRALMFWLYWKLKPFLVPIALIGCAFFSFDSDINSSLNINNYQLVLMVFGLLFVGIPHGALDHLTGFISKNKKISIKFILLYLMLMVPIFLIWLWFPLVGLIFFLVYSAWHFGQTDIEQWKISSKWVGFTWGSCLLSYLFLTHIPEFKTVLLALNVKEVLNFESFFLLKHFIIGLCFLLAVFYKKAEWLLLVTFLFFAQYVNLIFAFGLYFIFHHSRLGWLHLRKSLAISNLKMYVLALPFNIGAVALFYLFFTNFELSLNQNIAYFFIFLSCISFPHVLSMGVFYREK